MKLFKYGMPLAAVALLASCSNDNLDAPEVGVDTGNYEGTYVSFKVATPKTDGTRASNKGYTDGYAAEYGIHDVWLYLYRAETGKNLTADDAELYYCDQLNATDLTLEGTTSDAVTGSITATFQLKDMTEADKTNYDYYAFIVVNKPASVAAGTVTSATATGDKFSVLQNKTVGASGHVAVTVASGDLSFGDNLSAVNDMVIVDNNKYYFTMANAPLLSSDKTSVDYLVKLDNENFATSPKAASASAATVYVQRGVAKVEITGESSDTKHDVVIDEDGTTYQTEGKKAQVKINGWTLDVVNRSSYFVQKVEAPAAFSNTTSTGANWSGSWFVSNANLSDKAGKHIYWSIDPNYDQQYGQDNQLPNNTFLEIPSATTFDFNELNQVEYCLENTMNFNSMQKSQTTRIVFQTSLMVDGENAKSFVYYPGSDLIALVDEQVDLKSASQVGGEFPISEIFTDEAAAAIAKEVKAANTSEKVLYYPNGTSYYTALIRHFNDDEEAGLTEGNDFTDITKNPYTYQNLGRYGIVRNNAYSASVAKVYGFGLPTPPDPNDTPDDSPDPIKYNIMLDVKVLAWTNREGSYILK